MRRSSWHVLPLLLVTFFYFLAASTAQDTPNVAVDQVPLHDDSEVGDQPQWNHPPEQPSGKQAGKQQDLHVQDALKVLRKIRPPTVSRLARYTRKPSGFLGSSAYYVKQAFMLLFMNSPKPANLLESSGSSTESVSPQLTAAISLLNVAAARDNSDAIFLLAEMNFHGNFTHPVNYLNAFSHYKRLADLNGNSTAQYMLGFMYGVGLHPDIPADQAKSMLYHTFAAEQGNTKSEMTLAYRYNSGISTARDCDEAARWYRRVAEKAVRYYLSGPPGGHVLVRHAHRLADIDGGPYGEGASVSSAGKNARLGGPTSDAYASLEDVLEYLYMQSSKGELKATFGLARLYYDGERGLKRDVKQARKLFMSIARMYWAESGMIKKDASHVVERFATKSAGYLGRMFLRGEGMEQNYDRARVWFTRGVSNGDALSQYSLGLMYLEGYGVDRDVLKAHELLSAAADQDLAVAQTELGVLFLDQGDTRTATDYFEHATRNGHIEAFYYLAEMSNFGIGRDRSCGMAVNFYKIAAEKAEAVWASLAEANKAYEEGDNQKALIGYLMAAEQGCERSQANVAFLLDQTRPIWSPLSWFSSISSTTKASFSDAALALTYWTRSAKQQNLDSLVKMGDYYLSGFGTSSSPENAAACYQNAAESLLSAQAMWNLGWMHENGIGIEQDFHLAKRFYDQALDTNTEAYLPVKLSLWKLRWRSWWNGVTKGGVHGIEDDETPRKRRTFAEWFNAFLEADAQYYQEHYEPDDWDPQHENAQDTTPGVDEFWADEDLEDDLVDLLLIGGLIAALGWLIYYRQQQQRAAEQRRQDAAATQGGQGNGQNQQQQQQNLPPGQPGQQPDGGFFPPPGDPNWNNWVAGGVGH